MSLNPQALGEIPAETARIARAACPKGTIMMRLRDELGSLFTDDDFADLYPERGQPAYAPWRLAVVTVMQDVEGLTDRQAANAVRERIDWKYGLGLELSDAGFDFSLLSEFRERLVAGEAATRLLEKLLAKGKERGWLKAGGKHRTDSTHVLASVRALSHLEAVGETLRAALNELAAVAPDWLVAQVSEDWFERYRHRVENYRLPKEQSKRRELAEVIGRDGQQVLDALQHAETPGGLAQLESVQVLRQVWEQYYEVKAGQIRWRAGPKPPDAQVINSPYDPEARCSKKRETVWLGYKVHLTETCDDDPVRPHLIVQVRTTVATTPDVELTESIEQAVVKAGLAPAEHLVDGGYVDAELLVRSQQQYGIRLLGPASSDTSRPGRADQGYAQSQFHIDWQQRRVTCPQGQHSQSWKEWEQGQRIRVVFARSDCDACTVRAACTQAHHTGRQLNLQPQADFEALQARRREQTTPQFQREYARRAGIEGTLSQAVRTLGLRQARYRGLAKTQLQHILSAIAINVQRIDALLTQTPRGPTRHSPFAHLAHRYHRSHQQQAVG